MSDQIHSFLEEKMLQALQHHASRMLRSFASIRRWHDTGDIFQTAMLGLVTDLNKNEIRSRKSMYVFAATRIRWTLLDLAAKYACPSSLEANHQTWDGNPETTDCWRSSNSDSLIEWSEFHEAAGSLEPHLKAVFDLRWYFELPAQEVADILEISVSTEARRYRDARSAVGRAMSETLTLT